MYIKEKSIRQLIKDKGKRCSKSYLTWLDNQVRLMVENHIEFTRGTKTVNALDCAALNELNKLKRK